MSDDWQLSQGTVDFRNEERRAANDGPQIPPSRSTILVFSHDDVAVVHLDDGQCWENGRRLTLCGKRSFGVGLSRRKITCAECLKLKPKVLGGPS